MTDPLKSPTCRECAMARGLRVPGDVRTVVWRGVCANCGQEAYVSPARDWRPPGAYIYWEARD